jgi:surface-anchored protein
MRKLLLVLGVTATTVLAGIVPAQAAVTIEQGHVDGAWIRYAGGSVRLLVGDHSGGSFIERQPADVILRARPAAQTTVPAAPNPACLGAPGSPVWILPQVENVNLLWLGWSAASIPVGVVDGNQVTLRLKSVTPPSGGVLCVYSRSGFTTTKIFDSSDGLPDSVAIPVGAGGHRHVNWAFSRSGMWTAVFEATATVGGAAKSSGDHIYRFSVG